MCGASRNISGFGNGAVGGSSITEIVRKDKVEAWLRFSKSDLVGFLVLAWFLDAPGCVFDMSPMARRRSIGLFNGLGVFYLFGGE